MIDVMSAIWAARMSSCDKVSLTLTINSALEAWVVDNPASGPVEMQVLSSATCWRTPVRAVVSAPVVAGPPPARITSPTTSASIPPTAAAARAFTLTT